MHLVRADVIRHQVGSTVSVEATSLTAGLLRTWPSRCCENASEKIQNASCICWGDFIKHAADEETLSHAQGRAHAHSVGNPEINISLRPRVRVAHLQVVNSFSSRNVSCKEF